MDTLGVHWKIWILGGGSQKSNRGKLPKKVAWTVCKCKAGAWQERGGGDTPMHTMKGE